MDVRHHLQLASTLQHTTTHCNTLPHAAAERMHPMGHRHPVRRVAVRFHHTMTRSYMWLWHDSFVCVQKNALFQSPLPRSRTSKLCPFFFRECRVTGGGGIGGVHWLRKEVTMLVEHFHRIVILCWHCPCPMYMCVREKERERARARSRKKERVCVRVCVYVCERIHIHCWHCPYPICMCV